MVPPCERKAPDAKLWQNKARASKICTANFAKKIARPSLFQRSVSVTPCQPTPGHHLQVCKPAAGCTARARPTMASVPAAAAASTAAEVPLPPHSPPPEVRAHTNGGNCEILNCARRTHSPQAAVVEVSPAVTQIEQMARGPTMPFQPPAPAPALTRGTCLPTAAQLPASRRGSAQHCHWHWVLDTIVVTLARDHNTATPCLRAAPLCLVPRVVAWSRGRVGLHPSVPSVCPAADTAGGLPPRRPTAGLQPQRRPQGAARLRRGRGPSD